ncbi:hypothetical protein A9Q95_03220 [Rhodobacterales bacterium 59_46_T64]|nr:hypothetical protein A9Q95_03220 [Rhodobacterales bacterium 59_46_T64]
MSNQEQQLARKGRIVALVIAGTMLLWMGAQVLAAKLGWEARFLFLFDFAAIAAFIWVFVVIYQIWRARQKTT